MKSIVAINKGETTYMVQMAHIQGVPKNALLTLEAKTSGFKGPIAQIWKFGVLKTTCSKLSLSTGSSQFHTRITEKVRF